MQITPANLNFLFNQLDFSYQLGLQGAPTFFKEVATEIPSSTEQNVFPFLSMVPGLREWIGPRVFNNVAARSYTLPNKHFEGSLEVDRNKIEDDQFGI